MDDSTRPDYKHIHALPPVPSGETWSGVWTRETQPPASAASNAEPTRALPATRVKTTILGTPAAAVFIGRDIGVGERERAVIRRKAKDAAFISVISPYKASDAVAGVEPLKLDGPVRAEGVRVVHRDGGVDTIVVRYDGRAGAKPAEPTRFGADTTLARITIVRRDGGGKLIQRIALGEEDGK
jgi:hypothetical protein